MMQPRGYYTLPPVVTGYPLDDRVSVVVPVARTNLVTNPSLETGTSGWSAIGGTIARSTAYQYHGAYSLQITPTAGGTDGARFDTVPLVSGTTYAYSMKVLGLPGVQYKLCLESATEDILLTEGGDSLITEGGDFLVTEAGLIDTSGACVYFCGSGRWQWIYGSYTETASADRRLTIRKNSSADTHPFYIDGVQVEAIAAGETVSTYLDGAQQGLVPNQLPPAYVWNGTPHASTSTRSGLTRAGGMVIPFAKFGFFLTAIIGLGLAAPQNVAVEYARIDGGYDDYTRKPTRQFTIQGQFESQGDYLSLRQQRGGLSRLLDRDRVGQDQRLVLLRDVIDPCGACSELSTTTARLLGKYQGGLEGHTDNHLASVAPITFTQYLGVVLSDGESGGSLGVQTALTDVAHIAARSPAGGWANLSTGANANVWSLLWASDGKLYAGGEFTTIGGVSANRIAYWDGTAWHAMGTGGNAGAIYTIVEGPDGSIYAGGDPTSFGGVANTNYVAKWNGSAWSSVTGAAVANDAVQKLIFAPDGNLYAGGLFTSIGGVAANRIAKMTAAGVWSVMAGGSGTAVSAIAIAPNSRVYIGGDTSGDAVPDVSYWDGAAWVSTGSVTGGAAQITALAFGANGVLFMGGSYTAIAGIAANSTAQWNGVAWTPLGTGVVKSAGATTVAALVVLSDGTILVGGTFDTAGSITTVPNIARWNGSTWVYADVAIAWSVIDAIAVRVDGAMVIGGRGATSTGVATAQTTITNPGTARSYPTVTINGPASGTARIYQITNDTTGRAIYLNLTLSAGETATLIFTPDNLSFTSTFQGNIAGAILPGSNTADFFLTPGANTISCFSADATVTATLFYRPAFVSLDDVP